MGYGNCDGLFPCDSPIRKVFAERAVSFSGLRALLIQGAHPLAVAGFLQHTSGTSSPLKRLIRTDKAMNRIYFASRQDALTQIEKINRMHARVNGVLREAAGVFPAGTPYRADDPQLLLWVTATLADSAALYYRTFVGELNREELDRFWGEYRQIGELLGIPVAYSPQSWSELQRYLAEMLGSDTLYVLPEGRELADRTFKMSVLPSPFGRPLSEMVRQLTVGMLPKRVRELYGYRWDHLRGSLLTFNSQVVSRAVIPLTIRPLRLVPAA